MITQLPIYATMVLLVDDQPMISEAVRRLLSDQPNMRLHYCQNIQDALAQANDIKPTVILQDLVMPDTDGLKAVRRFRENATTADTPIIVLSSREDPQTKSQAFAAGANDYLVKLPDKVELIARIKYHSRSYLNQLQRDEAYRALSESQQQLLERNTTLITLNQVLEDTGRELHQAKLEADRANQAKSEFLSRMSHELRTPLHAILGFGQLLALDEMSAGQRENVAQIMTAGEHLLQLINEVLDLAAIEAGRIELVTESVNVQEVVAECVGLMGPLALKREIQIEFRSGTGCGFQVSADRQKLKQVLLNLLSNAVKYNRERGAISVSCEHTDDGRCLIKVQDTGPGIPPAQLNRLFSAFDRLGAERTGVEGTGLGLTVTKTLTELMGGEIKVESTLGVGSAFSILLPVWFPNRAGGKS